MLETTTRPQPAHPYRSPARPPQQQAAPRPLPEGMSQVQRAKLGIGDREARFWLLVTGLMLAFGVVNALADVVFRVLV